MAKAPRKTRDEDPKTPHPVKPRPRRRPRIAPAASAADQAILRFAVDAGRLLKDRHCQDVLLLDLRGKSDLMDYVLIGTGTSDRQILALADEVEKLAGETGLARLGREVDAPSSWLLLDFADVVVHLFDPPTRAHYDLEMLWGDAPRVPMARRVAAKATAE
jgi:ribosome-associated protein